ncbi:MAG: hypothetical protein L0J70_05135, partial [Corynebacterium sp.]|nr:hypothetical protein [Corynebacterium sp.]
MENTTVPTRPLGIRTPGNRTPQDATAPGGVTRRRFLTGAVVAGAGFTVAGGAGQAYAQAAPGGAPDAVSSGASGAYGEGRLQLAVGPSGVHADGPETFAALAEVARDLGLRRRTQANEQVDVAVAAQKYGRRPLELLAEWGWLEPGVTVAHLCDVTAD